MIQRQRRRAYTLVEVMLTMALLVIIRLIVERGAGGHPGERPDR